MKTAARLVCVCLTLAIAPIATTALAADGTGRAAPPSPSAGQLAQSLVATPEPGDLIVRLNTGADGLRPSSMINLRVEGSYLRGDGPRTVSLMFNFPRRIGLASHGERSFAFRPDYPLQAIDQICLNFANGGPAGTANDDWDLDAVTVAYMARDGQAVEILRLAGQPVTRFTGPTAVRCWPVDAPLPPA